MMFVEYSTLSATEAERRAQRDPTFHSRMRTRALRQITDDVDAAGRRFLAARQRALDLLAAMSASAR